MFIRNSDANELGPELLRSVHQCDNDLARAFFSSSNIATIQRDLKKIIFRKTGYTIGKQSDEQIGIVMRAMYVLHARHGTLNVPSEVQRLNAIVLSELVPQVGTGISQYLGYVRDASRLPAPMDRAKNMSIKGRNTLELFKGM